MHVLVPGPRHPYSSVRWRARLNSHLFTRNHMRVAIECLAVAGIAQRVRQRGGGIQHMLGCKRVQRARAPSGSFCNVICHGVWLSQSWQTIKVGGTWRRAYA